MKDMLLPARIFKHNSYISWINIYYHELSYDNKCLNLENTKFERTPYQEADERLRKPTAYERKHNMKRGWFLFRPIFSDEESLKKDTSSSVYDTYEEFIEDMKTPVPKIPENTNSVFFSRKPGNTGSEPIDEYYRRKNSLTQPPNDNVEAFQEKEES